MKHLLILSGSVIKVEIPPQAVKDFRNEGLCHSTCKEPWQAEEDGEDKFSIKQVAEEAGSGGSLTMNTSMTVGLVCKFVVIGSTYLFSHEYICI